MSNEVRAAILALDGKSAWGEVETAREALVPLGRNIFPIALELFPTLRSYKARTSLVYTAVKFALVEEDAVRLGVLALEDRSSIVIHRACMLLAVSRQRDVIPALEKLLGHKSSEVQNDAHAAIIAIEQQNPNLFLDRNQTGKVTLNVGGLIQPTL